MSSATLLALMFALICAAAGLLLWRASQVREGRAHAQRFFDSRVGQGARAAAPAGETRTARAPAAGTANAPESEQGFARWRASAFRAWAVLSDRAGLDEVRTGLVLALGVLVLLALWAGMAGGVLRPPGAPMTGTVLVAVSLKAYFGYAQARDWMAGVADLLTDRAFLYDGGKVTETEVGDEDSYYEVEVTDADGSQTDVQLDRGFNVVSSKADHEDGD